MAVTVRPHLYPTFSKTEPANFYVITSPAWQDKIAIETDSSYVDTGVLVYDGQDLAEVVNRAKEPAHVIIIAPDSYIRSIEDHEVGKRIICCMATNSTPTCLEDVAYFLESAERTIPEEQEKLGNRIFELGEDSEYLEWRDDQYGVSAIFRHQDDTLEWHEQTGPLTWGNQQLMPSGEVSVMPEFILNYDSSKLLDINGEIAFKGFPILHSGSVSFLRSDQERLHQKLLGIVDHAVIAKIEGGRITHLRASHPDVVPALEVMEAMMAVDSRYANLWEIGHGINTDFKLYPKNVAMNEVYGAENGAIHFGLGLIPWTQYHLDIICPQIKVLNDKGELIIGPRD